MKRLKLKANLAEIKSKVKEHAPELIIAATTIVGTIGWVMAGVYAKKLGANRVDEDPDWTNVQVPSHMMELLEDGHTLHYRQVRIDDNDCYTQYSTSLRGIGFDPEMDERFEEAKKERS